MLFFQAKVFLKFRKQPITTSWGDSELAKFLAGGKSWALRQGGEIRPSTIVEIEVEKMPAALRAMGLW